MQQMSRGCPHQRGGSRRARHAARRGGAHDPLARGGTWTPHYSEMITRTWRRRTWPLGWGGWGSICTWCPRGTSRLSRSARPGARRCNAAWGTRSRLIRRTMTAMMMPSPRACYGEYLTPPPTLHDVAPPPLAPPQPWPRELVREKLRQRRQAGALWRLQPIQPRRLSGCLAWGALGEAERARRLRRAPTPLIKALLTFLPLLLSQQVRCPSAPVRALVHRAAASAVAMSSRRRPVGQAMPRDAARSKHSRHAIAQRLASSGSATRRPSWVTKTAPQRARRCAATSAHPQFGVGISIVRSTSCAGLTRSLTVSPQQRRAAASRCATGTLRVSGRRSLVRHATDSESGSEKVKHFCEMVVSGGFK